jgi:signal transduction histidine kinase
MKRSLIIFSVLAVVLSLLLAAPGATEEKATREECIAKCKEAAKLVQESGLEAALAKMNDRNGAFVWKDSYVACVHIETGKLLAQPMTPNYIGYEVKFLSDSNGKTYMLDMIELAEKDGEGWVSYLYPKPGGDRTPMPKTSYVLKVPGEQVFVLAGYYE